MNGDGSLNSPEVHDLLTDVKKNIQENEHPLTPLTIYWEILRNCTRCRYEFTSLGGCPNCGETEKYGGTTDKKIPITHTFLDPFLRRIDFRDIEASYIQSESDYPLYEVNFNFAQQSKEDSMMCKRMHIRLKVTNDNSKSEEKFVAQITTLKWDDSEGQKDFLSVLDTNLKLDFSFRGIYEVRGQQFASISEKRLVIGSIDDFGEILVVTHEASHMEDDQQLTDLELRTHKAARLMVQTPFLPENIHNLDDLIMWYEKMGHQISRSDFEGISMTMNEAVEIVVEDEESAWRGAEEKVKELYGSSSKGLRETALGILKSKKEPSLATYTRARSKKQSSTHKI